MKPKLDKNIPIINENIRALKVQLITHQGENIGVIEINEALSLARESGLDLVQIAETGAEGVPVTKIQDYGKVLYEKKKKQVESKKHQKTVQIKEIKMRPKIGEHDYQTKLKQAAQFFQSGKHVKLTLVFRGREMATKYQRGAEMFEKIDKFFQDMGFGASLVYEKESKQGPMWSRVYYVKTK